MSDTSVKARSPWRLRALVLGAGALAGAALPPFSLWPALVPAFGVILWAVATAPTAREGAWRAWAAAVGWFALTMHWILQPFFVDAAATGWMAPFALVLLAGGLALFWALAGWIAGRLCAAGPARAFAFAGALTLAEALRSVVFTGLPWAEPGHGLIASQALALSAWGGPFGLTLVALLLAASTSALFLTRGIGLAVLPVAASLALGLIPLAPEAPAAEDDAPVVRIVQINAPQHLKWQPDMIPVFFERALALSQSAEGPLGPPDLIVWPETSLPELLDRSEQSRALIAQAAGAARVLVGTQRYAGIEPRNVLALLDPQGDVVQVYDKHHLVPFGEYIPLRDLADRFGLQGLAQQMAGGYRPGPGPEVMELGGGLRAFPMICYEAIFSRYLHAVARPDVMVQVTNDAWFGSFAMPYQHLALAQLRAAEQGLPLIRSANTGVSAMIDARGRILGSLEMDSQGVLDLALPPALPPTFYARTGDWPALLCAVFVTLSAVGWARRQRVH